MAHSAFANVDAYDLWAKSYPPVPHNPLMRAEQQAMIDLWPDIDASTAADLRALDLACGTGRYARLLAERGIARSVAVDFSTAMLQHSGAQWRVRADMMKLPFAAGSFHVVVCGLAVGHAPRLEPWMMEMARILAPGGWLLYSDFHPAAAAAGMTRSFTDEHDRKHTLLHRRYELPAHREAAAAAKLEIEMTREVRVGHEMHEQFDGSAAFYRRWQGLPVVLAVRVRKGRHA